MNKEYSLLPIQNSRKITSRISSTSTRRAAAQAMSRRSQFLRGQLLALPDIAMLRRSESLQSAAAISAAAPGRSGRPPRRRNNSAQTPPAPRSIPESRRPGWPKSRNRSGPALLAAAPCLRLGAIRVEIDLVAHHPYRRGVVRAAILRRCASISHSTRSASAARARARRTPSCSTGSSVSRMPAVSITVTG